MLEPAGHRVLVFPEEVKEMSSGGIILPQDSRMREQNATQVGTVIKLGKTAFKAFDDGEHWCEVGDKVFFARYGGQVVEDPDDGKEYRVLNDDDVVAIIRLKTKK